ncbi:hypothetical protein BW723_10075 [Polaribacter reichenbachii]|uniref:Outer membrane protein beta-barrel domain-containing protein n=1 Tax=Polaribacter reichenbachii TaxID=996801 RepID=A0A1B8U5K6_9FLAO|nr:hypothetical protein [Polaribacter reichenbachii]APZ46619.1 hypothetical protein BW723_10075 [Polaribacter reichenbachii]AUC17264.1 hypothetical protein BTO17_00525 [Polaribacter reichenbachii]OBY67138.1 hypothetical protein LPB301_03755 [Polaribacter reichenbachii]
MKLKKHLIYIFVFFFCLQIKAQEDKEVKEKKNAIAVSFGSTGLGLEYARKLSNKLNARFVWHSLKIEDFEQEDVEIKSDLVDILANLEVSIVDIGIEYLPFKNSSFKLTAGLGILNKVNLNGVVTYNEDVVFGEVVITNEDAGEIIADITWTDTAPYVGIGFGRAIPKNRLGFGIEFGSYITSSPKIDLTASNLLENTASQKENLQESLEDFKFIPRIQIRIAYKF